MSLTKKDRKLSPEQFLEFEHCYGSDPNGKAKRKVTDSKEDRWRLFHIEEIKQRDFKIDGLKWLKDESLDDGEESLQPEELVRDAIAELQLAIEELNSVLVLLEGEKGSEALIRALSKE